MVPVNVSRMNFKTTSGYVRGNFLRRYGHYSETRYGNLKKNKKHSTAKSFFVFNFAMYCYISVADEKQTNKKNFYPRWARLIIQYALSSSILDSYTKKGKIVSSFLKKNFKEPVKLETPGLKRTLTLMSIQFSSSEEYMFCFCFFTLILSGTLLMR